MSLADIATSLFAYEHLEAEDRIVAQQAAKEIHDEIEAMRRSAIKIGQRLIAVRERLKPRGQWGAWLQREFQWSDQTALNYIGVAEVGAQNPKFLELESQFGRSALIELAKDSTPPAAREEALRRAENGERIGHGAAKAIIAEAKESASVAPLARGEFSGPLAPVADAIRRRDAKAGYEAARGVSIDLYPQAMAAIDTLVEGKGVDAALIVLSRPVPSKAEPAAWGTPGFKERGIYLHTPPELVPADWDAWRARLQAIGGDLTLGSGGVVTGNDGQRRLGSYALPVGWPKMTAEIEALERRSEAPPTFDYVAWEKRAHALGANLKSYGLHYELVEPDGTSSRYPNGCEDQLARRIAHLEGAAESPAVAPVLPASDPPDDTPDPDEAEISPWEEVDDAHGLAVMVRSEGLPPAARMAIPQIAEALRLIGLGRHDQVDVWTLDELRKTLLEENGPASKVLIEILELVADAAEFEEEVSQ